MVQKFFTAVRQAYQFVVSLVITAVLGVATWGCWRLYEEISVQQLFADEGQRVTVRVDQVSDEQRSWRDMAGNAVYLTTTYRGQLYLTRYVTDTTYAKKGDRVQLLYHPTYNALRQPDQGSWFRQTSGKSRLIRWSTIETFSLANKWLLLCLIVSTAFFFCASGVLVSIVPVPFLQDMARLLLVIELVAASAFFAYDTYAYFRYYQRLKVLNQTERVTILATDRRSIGRGSRSGWYDYEATIRRNRQEYLIPISRDDYERLRAGNSLTVFYDPARPDFMSVDFPPDYTRVILPIFLGVLAIVGLRSGWGRPQSRTKSLN